MRHRAVSACDHQRVRPRRPLPIHAFRSQARRPPTACMPEKFTLAGVDMSRVIYFSVPALLAALVVALGSAARPQDPNDVDARLVALEGQIVPIGGVILWWGSEGDEPAGFES